MKHEGTNSFSGGLVSDLNAITTPNTVVTDCINGSFLTMNGNELVLQNDMGNTKLTTPDLELTENFIPIGIKEHGGILYILSNNPNTKETELGSFPSFSLENENIIVKNITINFDAIGSSLNKNYLLSDKRINPGEGFILFLKSNTDFSLISTIDDPRFYKPKLVTIENGIEFDVTSTLDRQTKYVNTSGGIDNFAYPSDKFWFVPLTTTYSNGDYLVYTNNNKYQNLKSRIGGKLAIKFELETINSFKIPNIYPKLSLSAGSFKLTFDFDITTKSLIGADKIKLEISTYDILTNDYTTYNLTTDSFTMVKNASSPTIPSVVLDIGDNCLKIVEYTITPINENCQIKFDNFQLKGLIDISKDPSTWGGIPEYSIHDYNILNYKII